MGVRVEEKGDEEYGWESFGRGSLRSVSFHWQHVIIPRPGAECNNCKRRSSDFSHRSGFPDCDLRPHSGSVPDSPVIPILGKKDDPGNYRVGIALLAVSLLRSRRRLNTSLQMTQSLNHKSHQKTFPARPFISMHSSADALSFLVPLTPHQGITASRHHTDQE